LAELKKIWRWFIKLFNKTCKIILQKQSFFAPIVKRLGFKLKMKRS
jgi:hypothetical protein